MQELMKLDLNRKNGTLRNWKEILFQYCICSLPVSYSLAAFLADFTSSSSQGNYLVICICAVGNVASRSPLLFWHFPDCIHYPIGLQYSSGFSKKVSLLFFRRGSKSLQLPLVTFPSMSLHKFRYFLCIVENFQVVTTSFPYKVRLFWASPTSHDIKPARPTLQKRNEI